MNILCDLVGDSSQMSAVKKFITQAAGSDCPALITGETGTGKELVARAIYALGARCKKPFIPINCAAIPAELLESEMFGNVKGAFTGARDNHKGAFLEAAGGTLFLDEVGDMSHALQAKLLRALDREQKVRVIGENVEQQVNVRIVASTNCDLEGAVREKRFRQDLYYRLKVIHIHIPPLRDRPGDVPMLIDHFMGKFTLQYRREIALTHGERSLLDKHSWPGNVRELENKIEELFVCGNERVSSWEIVLPKSIQRDGGGLTLEFGESVNLPEVLDRIERRYIEAALNRTQGNMTAAAEHLGLNRTTLAAKLRRSRYQRAFRCSFPDEVIRVEDLNALEALGELKSNGDPDNREFL